MSHFRGFSEGIARALGDRRDDDSGKEFLALMTHITRPTRPKAPWQGLALVMIPAVVLIGLDVYQIAENVPELRQSQDLVAHTIEVITETQALETAIRDTEREPARLPDHRGCSLSGSLQIGGGAGSRHPFKAKAAHRRQS